MTHKIRISSEHIAKGTRESDTTCPIALALTEHFGHQVRVDLHVGSKPSTPICQIRDKEGWKNLTVGNPQKFVDFVEKFDNGKKVSPFYLTIED